MVTRNKILFLCGLILIAAVNVSAQKWRKIEPLRSTRADVERLLGTNENSYGVVYEFEDGNLLMEYSSGRAEKTDGEAGMFRMASL
jgi:hypothetical protein